MAGGQKVLSLNDYTKTFYSLYISKRYCPCIFVWAYCGSDVIVIYDVIEHKAEMIRCANASRVWIRLFVAWNFFSVCSWICQIVAPWHPILWKPWQIRLWIFHLHLWIYDSLICGSHKLQLFSQLRLYVNIWQYQKEIIKNFTVNYISWVHEALGLIEISNLLHGTLDGQRAGSKPHAPSPKFGTAVQSYVYYFLAGCSCVYFRTPRPLSKK